MRLATIQTAAGPRAALLQDNHYVDLHSVDSTLPKTIRSLIEAGAPALKAARQAAERNVNIDRYEASAVKTLPPIPDPPKIVCLGLNYRDHAIESGAPIPKEPILFSKYATALIGPGEAIVLPSVSQEVDYEAELGVVIGRRARQVSRQDALEYIAGYTIVHDVSARDLQFSDGQWLRAKSFNTFAPMGPYLVTKSALADGDGLAIELRLNGKTMQKSNTRNLIFKVPDLVSYISEIMTLEVGDVIATGTPGGVGFVRNPQVFMKPGDVVEIEIEGIGVLRNPVADFD